MVFNKVTAHSGLGDGERDLGSQVAKIETERLLVELVEAEVARRKAAGRFAGKFNALTHYLGYEGRSGLPSNFDSTWATFLPQTPA